MLFDTIGKSFWNMFVCLTLENFPDVMLEATAVNSLFSLFFIVFILVGVFFLTSVLLAVIFDNYKRRMQGMQKRNISERINHIEKIYNAYDVDEKGWLTTKQTRGFFESVLDLNQSKSHHRKVLK